MAVLAASLTGCATTRDTTEPPAELQVIEDQVSVDVVWSRSTGDGSGQLRSAFQPVIVDDELYTLDRDGFLIAMDKRTGDTRWSKKHRLRISAGLAADDRQLYAGTVDGQLVAFNRENGAIEWQMPLESELIATPTSAFGNVVVHTVDGKIMAVNTTSGDLIWSYSHTVPALSQRGSSRPLVSSGQVFVGSDDGRLIILSLNDGLLLWDGPVAVPSGRSDLERMVDVDIQPVIVGSTLFASALNTRIIALDLREQRMLWRRDKSSYLELAVDEQYVYLIDGASHVWALDRQSGTTAWTQDDLNARPLSSPALVDDRYVVVGDFAGYVHVLDIDNGEFVGRRKLSSDPYQTAPLVDENMAYFHNREGYLTAVRLTPATDRIAQRL